MSNLNKRPETGPMQFGDDWTGLFIRGDHCAYYALHLKLLLDMLDKTDTNELSILVVQGLLDSLGGTREDIDFNNVIEVQKLQSFEKCNKNII